MSRLLASVPLVLLALAACSKSGDDSSSSESMQTANDKFALYPTEIRPGLQKLARLDPLNVSVGDFGTAVRDQGSIASCASFGFLGLLENQMFNERGISPDLAERFMIFSNFYQTGTLGGDPKVIAQFPNLVTNLGLLTEDVYPYAAVDANADRFDQDAAQGLTTDHTKPSLASAIEGTAPESRERADILEKPEFIGALPAGPFPVTIPLKATFQPHPNVQQVEFEGKIYDCFSQDAAPPEKQLKLTPREFLAMCFDLDPKQYYTCGFDAAQAANEAAAHTIATDECGQNREVADAIAPQWLEAHRKMLQLTLALLDHGDASMLGVTAPASPRNLLAVWSTKDLQLGAGHAVLAIGYLTFEELQSAKEQDRGILKSGMFDKLTAMVDPDFASKLSAGLPDDPAARRDLRLASKMGQRMAAEGGIILFRNSWGAKLQDFSIGVDGHQAMTFDYVLKAGILGQGRMQPRIPLVSWQSGAGPATCPADVNVAQAATWLKSPDRLEAIKAHLRAMSASPSCSSQ